MKLFILIVLITLLGGASTSGTLVSSTCQEDCGLCVCKGECPAFTNSWVVTATADCACVAANSYDYTNGLSVESETKFSLNGKTYSCDSLMSCDDASAAGSGCSSAKMLDSSYYATVLVTAAAVVGYVAFL